MVKEINEILKQWTDNEISTEEANKKLEELGAGFHLDPDKKGNALLDSGIGCKDVVNVVDGKLEGGPATYCTIYYNGKAWHTEGDDPTLIEGEYPHAPAEPVQKELDMSRRSDLANTTQIQTLGHLKYEVTYNELGYAIKAVKVKA